MTKFIIISAPRSGSSYLRYLLNSHPNVKCKGELLNKKITRLKPYLTREIWNSKGFKALGFKILYDQAETKYPSMWNYIHQQNLKVIHLIRRNKLDMLLSEELAKEHKCHISFNEKDIHTRPVNISLKKLEQKIQYCKEMQEKVDAMFTDRINVYYEELNTNQILEFLGVPLAILTPKTIKLTTKSKEELISNWEELVAQFRQNSISL